MPSGMGLLNAVLVEGGSAVPDGSMKNAVVLFDELLLVAEFAELHGSPAGARDPLMLVVFRVAGPFHLHGFVIGTSQSVDVRVHPQTRRSD